MKRSILFVFFSLLSAYAFAQMESNRQVEAGFGMFISRIVLIGSSIITLVFLFLVVKNSNWWVKSSRKTNQKRRHRRQNAHNPKVEKNRSLYQKLFYISLAVVLISFYAMLKYSKEYAKPDEVVADPFAPPM